MSAPITSALLRRAKVVIAYTDSTGYTAEVAYASIPRDGMPQSDPHTAILEAMQELVRIATLCGLRNEVMQRTQIQVAEVEAWQRDQGRKFIITK